MFYNQAHNICISYLCAMYNFNHLLFLVFQCFCFGRSRLYIPFNILITTPSRSSISSDSISSSPSAPKGEDNCNDGVCSIPSLTAATTDLLSKNNSLEEKILQEWNQASTSNGSNIDSSKVQEVVKLGWTESQALYALNNTQYNIEDAITLLEKEEEEVQQLQANIKILCNQYGWKEEAAESALIQTNQNISSSIELLENEEKIILENFETAVKDMIQNGWHEYVARQALVTQWTIDQKTAAGINVTFPVESLQSIHPTLKRPNETTVSNPNTATTTKGATGSTTSKGQNKDTNKPTPAKREDCIFDITSENFQKLVIESSVPVILDVYADWCGPCKQLGPILEDAAMNSGGMFRLGKVNSDSQSSIAHTLNVNSLPTVFAINNGKITDRFIGMLPTEQLQQFLVRCITGYGERVQKEQFSEKDVAEYTFKMVNMAGMASMTFRKKEKLYKLIENALIGYNPIATAITSDVPSTVTSSESLQTALLYINNAAKDIMNPKFRKISMESKAYKDRIAGHTHSVKLLEIAGFRNIASTAAGAAANGNASAVLELNHKNAALLTLISQVNKQTDR